MKYVYFIGAGPGDKELITIKGAKILSIADVVIYTGSLVNQEILSYCKSENVEIYNSAVMNLHQVTDLIYQSFLQKKIVARVHTGDPSLYGAILEQITFLEANGIDFEIIPGVSSAFAAAAASKSELTLPEISQTVIFTRLEGRTPVPPQENLENIAKIGCTLIIFLSVSMIDEVRDSLLKGEYTHDTPVVIAKRVSWSDEEIFYTNVSKMCETVKNNKISKTALIMVGDVFNRKNRNFESLIKSKLYDKNFKTEFRD